MKQQTLSTLLVFGLFTLVGLAQSPMLGRKLPPEAFIQPKNYLALVNVNQAVADSAWLEEHRAFMQEQLRVRVEVLPLEAGKEALANPRAMAKELQKAKPEAKLLVFIAAGDDLAPMLASPYENWGMMDAGMITKAGGDKETMEKRLGKRIFQALGHIVGAGYRAEKEACLRFSPTAQSLDDALSSGFHPLNGNIFQNVASSIGLETIRMRPRKELIEMGIIKPRKPGKPAPAVKTAAPAAK